MEKRKIWEIMREIPSHSDFIEKHPEEARITKEEFDAFEDEWLYFLEKIDKEIPLEKRIEIIKKSCLDTIKFYQEKEQKVIEQYKTIEEDNYSESKEKLYQDLKSFQETRKQWEENMENLSKNPPAGIFLLRNIKPYDKSHIEEIGFEKWLYRNWLFLTL